jgi:hypothetical protein
MNICDYMSAWYVIAVTTQQGVCRAYFRYTVATSPKHASKLEVSDLSNNTVVGACCAGAVAWLAPPTYEAAK